MKRKKVSRDLTMRCYRKYKGDMLVLLHNDEQDDVSVKGMAGHLQHQLLAMGKMKILSRPERRDRFSTLIASFAASSPHMLELR